MEKILEFIYGAILSSTPLQIAGIAAIYMAMGVILIKTGLAKRISQSFLLLFYAEPGRDSATATRRRVIELEREMHLLRRSFSDKNFQVRQEAILAELEGRLTRELPELVDRKLSEIRALDNSIDSVIRSTIDKSIASYLKEMAPSQLLVDRRALQRDSERVERSKILETTIEEQMRSAGRLKSVMINLFVIFNIGILLVYLFAAASLSDRAVTAIIGLYVSLAAFIVYIYRTSNFRSSILLALREDAKKYFDADEYLKRLKQGASPSERDIEVLKLLLVNRSEREKMANHPYEVILKGVTNSNIQMKGGKMSVPKKEQQ